MNGCGCGRLANSGCWTAGRPKASGLGVVMGPSGIGDAAATAGGARTRAKTIETAPTEANRRAATARCCHAGTAAHGASLGAAGLHLLLHARQPSAADPTG